MKTLILILTTIFSFSTFAAKNVDLKKSTFQWTGEKLKEKHTGKIKLKSAKLTTSKKGKITGGTLVMNMDSITVEDIKSATYNKKFINHMKDDDFFSVKKYPTATLIVESLENGNAKAKMTLKDKTQPVAIKYTEKDGIYKGKFVFDRTKYGVIYGSKNFFKSLIDKKVIKNEITIEFTLVTK